MVETVPRLACLYRHRSVRGERLDVAGAGRLCPYTGRRPRPVTGEQSVEILREAGLSEAEIQALLDAGATLDGRLKS